MQTVVLNVESQQVTKKILRSTWTRMYQLFQISSTEESWKKVDKAIEDESVEEAFKLVNSAEKLKDLFLTC